MKTIGQLFRETRQEHQRTLSDIAQKTKIREDFLEAIEREQFSRLPQGPFIVGFLTSYANELGLDAEHVLAIYRRDFGKTGNQVLVPKGVLNPIKKTALAFTPTFLGGLVIGVVVFGYLVLQWVSFHQPPPLTVREPVEGAELHSPVLVKGKTATDAVVTINALPLAIDQNGAFETTLELGVGQRTIVVEAKNRQGKSRIVERVVRVIE